MGTILLLWFFLSSLFLFVLIGVDKKRARERKYRISEKTLLLVGILGGALGGIIGMNLFRHKTKHRYFYWTYLLAIIGWGSIFLFQFFNHQ
ncbi:DUF1294 domain-containing protein [Jeotgalibaca caeni]|uniref:DUF1294 domain-containing protein n=1 Tax=Jeotgalibaca caeni TaxID=3028623 RepID=UPI00237D6806|nr:DUF1294 domain-containing protein [Jeotgalibaca caeni]MDE1549058.1 DUF1294 domain-containing protein [Jeotgalibaca caeni]